MRFSLLTAGISCRHPQMDISKFGVSLMESVLIHWRNTQPGWVDHFLTQIRSDKSVFLLMVNYWHHVHGIKRSIFGTSNPGSVWEQSKMNVRFVIIEFHRVKVLCCQFSKKAEFIVSGGVDKMVKVWNSSNGKCIKILKGHTGWVCIVWLI